MALADDVCITAARPLGHASRSSRDWVASNALLDRCRRSSARPSLLALFLLTGCATFSGYPKDPEDSSVHSALTTKYFSADSEKRYDDETASDKREAIRDEIVYGRIRVYDLEFSSFQRALNENGNGIAVGSDLTALVLNGLGATTGGAATKAALSAASAGVIGANGVVNKDLYYQKTVSAIISQMEANRAKAELAIITGLKQPDSVYSLKRADLDLGVLKDAGSLPNAISNITQQSSSTKNATQALIQSYQATIFIQTDSGKKIKAWLYPSGKLDQNNFIKLQTWLNNDQDTSLHELPPPVFVEGDSTNLEAARKRAVSALNIP